MEEEYMCDKCEKTFTKKINLDKHIKEQVCTKSFICNKCEKKFTSSYGLRKHRNKKSPCVPNEVPVININSNENKCMYCGKCYANGYSLKRHIGTCPMKNNQAAMFQMMANLMEENKQLRERNGQLTIQNNNNLTVNQTINQNMYVNVTICSFGNEDLTKLDQQGVIDLLKGQVEDFMSKMIEYIHANPDHPEHHNVFYDPVRKKSLVFKQNNNQQLTWQFEDIEHVSKLLTDKIKNHIHPLNSPYFNTLAKIDIETANKIPQILCTNWNTPNAIEGTKMSLSKISKNEGFMDQVKVLE